MQATFKYHQLLERIITEGKVKENRTGTNTISIFSHTIEFDMSQGFPLITTKKMFTKGIIGELLWFLRGSKDIRELWNNNIKIWDGNWYDRYCKSVASPWGLDDIKELIKSGEHSFDDDMFSLGPIYGKQWVNWSPSVKIPTGWHHGAATSYEEIGLNQIQQTIDTLNNSPDSRRIMVTAWNPAEISGMALPPCHWAFELYTEELTLDERIQWVMNNLDIDLENVAITEAAFDPLRTPQRRLHLKWHQRSVDTFLGLPFNIASYAMLLEMFAQQANMIPGTLIGDLTNVHIYENHIDLAKEQLTRSPFKYKSPGFTLNKANDIFSYKIEDFKMLNYESYPNWKDVPMAV
jgi:thymidylate synthase